jgi:hypothetical protein
MAVIYYLLRSQQNGQYLAARPPSGAGNDLQDQAPQAQGSQKIQGSQAQEPQTQRYLLLFQQDFEALSYINAHAPEARDRFAVESHNLNQLKTSLERWGFAGVAFVTDPLEPQVDFLARRLL